MNDCLYEQGFYHVKLMKLKNIGNPHLFFLHFDIYLGTNGQELGSNCLVGTHLGTSIQIEFMNGLNVSDNYKRDKMIFEKFHYHDFSKYRNDIWHSHNANEITIHNHPLLHFNEHPIYSYEHGKDIFLIFLKDLIDASDNFVFQFHGQSYQLKSLYRQINILLNMDSKSISNYISNLKKEFPLKNEIMDHKRKRHFEACLQLKNEEHKKTKI